MNIDIVYLEKTYEKLLKSGMFWEWYPELSGTWIDDKNVILENLNNFPELLVGNKECK